MAAVEIDSLYIFTKVDILIGVRCPFQISRELQTRNLRKLGV